MVISGKRERGKFLQISLQPSEHGIIRDGIEERIPVRKCDSVFLNEDRYLFLCNRIQILYVDMYGFAESGRGHLRFINGEFLLHAW